MHADRFFIRIALVVAALAGGAVCSPALAAGKPNIVVILSDDQGYADVSFNKHHAAEVATPHIDALAASGVICTNGYVTGHVCSPTRAGLMTGRYQQRAGIYTAGEGGSGLPLSETIFPQYLKAAGYVSGAFGKWHLGLTSEFNPASRGFDEFFGFLGRGAHDYFKLDDPDSPIYRGLEPVAEQGYLTDRLTDEAVSFIERHKEQPFFVYLAYNAVHSPAQAPADEIKRFNTGDELRDTLLAMLIHLDSGVGRVVAALEAAGVRDNTLLFFLTDNGGSKAMHADNAPLRGFKQQDYEGGIRVPFVVSWPARLPAGATCDVPLMSLDILPTALAAAGVATPVERPFDGRDMLPALAGQIESLHDTMYWSSGGDSGQWAVRHGNRKLVAERDKLELFDLETDVAETTDLTGLEPEMVEALTVLYETWLAEMAEPASGQSKTWSADQPVRQRASKEKKKADRERLQLERKEQRKKSKESS